MRLRIIAPARYLAAIRPVAVLPIDYVLAHPDLEGYERPEAVVIGKLSSSDVIARAPSLRALLDWLGTWTEGIEAFADFSDNYAAYGQATGQPFLAEYQRRLGEMCRFVTPCDALAQELAPWARRGIEVVEDPWESPRQNPPRFAPSRTLRLCWFGNVGPMNFEPLRDMLARCLARLGGRSATLSVVTSATRSDLVAQLEAALRTANAQVAFEFVPWSPNATWRAIDDCDIVLLPQDTERDWSRGKSHNRLVEAIRGGRLAVASPIPSYLELASGAWVGEDLASGVEWALDHPDEVKRRIEAGQALIAPRFSPEAVGRRWAQVLGIDDPRGADGPSRMHTKSAIPLRLNLGCGDKILEGYVNVDVAASRAGKSPDVLCDLRRLEPFADDSADEVMAIHVVEHFWRWEVLDVLREWARVLKPGGRMILECPNLLTACEELLRNPAAAGATDQEAQRTMWVLYGDPRWQDPLMTHRWNYTPQSLAALMQEAGLVKVRQEPAQFKLREPRDMRVVGEKPAGPA